VDDLKAIPRIDIYGEEEARAVLRGEYRDMWAPAGVTGMTVTAWGGNGGRPGGGGGGGNGSYPYTVVSGAGYTAGGNGGCGSSNCVSGAGSGGGGWGNSMWSAHAYGNMIVRPGDIVTITGV